MIPIFAAEDRLAGNKYSSEKIIGDWHIKTIWFNLSILLLMSIIVTWMLLTDCPGRFVRKDAQ